MTIGAGTASTIATIEAATEASVALNNGTMAMQNYGSLSSNEIEFKGLQYALLMTTFVEVLGGVFFLITSMYILRDKTRAEKAVAGM